MEPRAGLVVPNYEPTGEIICAMMGLLFGKRFDPHGAFEMTGSFRVPDLASASELCDSTLPFHSGKPRADYSAPLKISELNRIQSLLEGGAKDLKCLAALQTGALFYMRALRVAETNPEIAYLHLITAGERLAEVVPFDADRGLEAVVSSALAKIKAELSDGERIAGLFRARLRQLKRRYCSLICGSLDEMFFSRTEATDGFGSLKKASFPRAAAAAYDLRSRYVHTGASFGKWVQPRRGNEERQIGKPIVGNRGFETVLHHAPTFIGLERLTRVALLTLAEELGAVLPPPGGAADTSTSPSRATRAV
jgi:hypothetical protein